MKPQVQCFNCKQCGYLASNCFANTRNQVEVKIFSCWHLKMLMTQRICHMRGKRNMFVDMDETIDGQVTVGDFSKL